MCHRGASCMHQTLHTRHRPDWHFERFSGMIDDVEAVGDGLKLTSFSRKAI